MREGVEPPSRILPNVGGSCPRLRAVQMYLETVSRVTFYERLHRIDQDLAAECRRGRCPYCGGRLDLAPYERKPRGGPEGIPAEVLVRLSLCCGEEGCRRRTLPPSCLFLGPKVYWAAIVLVVVALRQRRPGSFSAAKLRGLFGVSWETVLRWMEMFASEVPVSASWRRLRGLVPGTVRDDDLPAGLLELLVSTRGNAEEGLVEGLALLSAGRVIVHTL